MHPFFSQPLAAQGFLLVQDIAASHLPHLNAPLLHRWHGQAAHAKEGNACGVLHL
jgi:hypothetical protein